MSVAFSKSKIHILSHRVKNKFLNLLTKKRDRQEKALETTFSVLQRIINKRNKPAFNILKWELTKKYMVNML